MDVAVSIRELSHTYRRGNRRVLEHVSLDIRQGERLVLVGPSGAGKSTLLRCINRLVRPTSGSVFVFGKNVVKASRADVVHIRRQIGMVFQGFNLINRISALENVLVGRLGYLSTVRSALGLYRKEDVAEAMHALDRVGLTDHAGAFAMDLSGGQRQRVAIARALAQRPKILLADEPVSNLDPHLMHEILKLLRGICEENDITLVCSLHLIDLAQEYGTRIVAVKNRELIPFQGHHLTEEEIRTIYGPGQVR